MSPFCNDQNNNSLRTYVRKYRDDLGDRYKTYVYIDKSISRPCVLPLLYSTLKLKTICKCIELTIAHSIEANCDL